MSVAGSDHQLRALLLEGIAARDFPSAVYLVAQRGRIICSGALGQAVRVPVQIPATTETVYDFASLTKPLVTGLLCAKLCERKVICLDDPISRHLHEFARDDKRALTIGQLLTHSSGLPAWLALCILTRGERARTLDLIAAQPLDAAPGTRVIYSDLGFITLGFLIERVFSLPLAAIADREIFTPLGLTSTCFNPPEFWRPRIAASEQGNNYEHEMFCRANPHHAGEQQQKQQWRQHVIWGEVHDGNAYFLGGAAGHAGLFSTARDALRLAEQFLAERTEILTPSTCPLFSTDLTPGLNEARSVSWQLAATPDSTAGPHLAARSFGHTGFTGTSCWVDAEHQRIFILLTNRTHDHPPPFANINQLRRRFHSLATQA
ncbi:MAG: serine hydrolase domain-containing protein [Pyrinomonadaceae bacterium]